MVTTRASPLGSHPWCAGKSGRQRLLLTALLGVVGERHGSNSSSSKGEEHQKHLADRDTGIRDSAAIARKAPFNFAHRRLRVTVIRAGIGRADTGSESS
ncbi:hypothetical protein [Streptomyces sp. NPDC085529]|uniref:hypothetical protein n=1 Tax=Streptomyces sp. NPDC085529 TaxID=3365729 RepID=UPI0037D22352